MACREHGIHCQKTEVEDVTLAQNIFCFLHLNNDALYSFSNLGRFSLPTHHVKALFSAPKAGKVCYDTVSHGGGEYSALSRRPISLQYHIEPSFSKKWALYFYVKNGAPMFQKNDGVIGYRTFLCLKDIAENDCSGAPLQFYCCWEQRISSIQKMPWLQHKELFLVIPCSEA